jgi:hypothetical protein
MFRPIEDISSSVNLQIAYDSFPWSQSRATLFGSSAQLLLRVRNGKTYTASTGLNSLKISVQSSYYVVTNEEAD